MDYTGMQFFRLTEAVEAQGGTHLDQLHRQVPITVPVQGEKGESAKLYSTGCNDAALLSIPYERGLYADAPAKDQMVDYRRTETRMEDGKKVAKSVPAMLAAPLGEKSDKLVVCAKDDFVGEWPRFKGTWEKEQ